MRTTEYPIRKFLNFKRELEQIFSPFISLLKRTSIALFIITITLYVLHTEMDFPEDELLRLELGTGLGLVLFLVGAAVLLYLVIIVSTSIREIMIIELKEAKIKTLKEKNLNEVGTTLKALEEIEELVSNQKYIFLPSKDAADLLGGVVAILITTLAHVIHII